MPAGAELIDVGKRPGRPSPQELISALLVDLGRQGKRVVRLKGGDPFVFGRGGEEALALHEAGVDYEIVPGITLVDRRAPMAAGIPVTHRGVSAAFTVVTGHRRAGEHDVDWRSLANVGGTIVILMGVAQRASIAAELIAGGLDPHDAGRGDPLGDHRRADGPPLHARPNSATRRSSHRRHRRSDRSPPCSIYAS